MMPQGKITLINNLVVRSVGTVIRLGDGRTELSSQK